MLAKFIPLLMAAMAGYLGVLELFHPLGNWGWAMVWISTAFLYTGVYIALH